MNVLVLAADSLRADHLDPRVAPNLAAFAASANGVTVFDRAYVSLPRTFPSWVTILTGRHPHHHGIRTMFPRWEEREKDFDAVPQRFAAAGYGTAVVSDYAGDIFGRIALGFDRVDVPAFDFRELVRQRALEPETPLLPLLHTQLGRRLFPVMRERNDAADPAMLEADAARALHALAARPDKPFFLTVFFSTAHFPYAAPAPYYRRFTDPAYRGRFKYHKPVGLTGDAEHGGSGADARGAGGDGEAVDAADVAQIRALYDGAVASLDDAAGKLLRDLDDEGLASSTLVVVTADHGETLYENGHGQGHGDHLFGDEGTHVPLVVRDPRKAAPPRRVSAIVRDVDVAPTLYALAGVEPPGDLDGRSLAPAMDGAPLAPALAYAETELWFTERIAGLPAAMRMPYPGIEKLTELDTDHGSELVLQAAVAPITLMARHRMVRDARWKLVYVPSRGGVSYLLFDTVEDPGEVTDVAAVHPDVVERLRGELWAYMLRDPAMVGRGGYLLPRRFGRDTSAKAGVRLGGGGAP